MNIYIGNIIVSNTKDIRKDKGNFMCRAILIAEVVINECIDLGYSLNTSKLQKILYYMQKEHLKKYGEPVFNEQIVAWECGPAIVEIYSFFKKGRIEFREKVESKIILLNSHKIVMDIVLGKYGKLKPYEVAEQSQTEKPWIHIWNNGEGKGKEIPIDLICPKEERCFNRD